MPRHVIFLVSSLARAGAEHNVAMRCKYMDQQRYQPEVWLFKTGEPLEKIVREAGVEIRRFDRGSKFSPLSALRVARQIARAKFDLLHAYLPNVAVYAALAKILFGLPQPMILRCGWSSDPGRAARWRYGWLYRRAFSLFTANSSSAAEFLESMGIERERIRMIPNIYELDSYRQAVDRCQIRSTLGIEADAPLLIYVGRLYATKRVEDLIEAVARLAPKRPTLRLILVGDGPESQQLQRQIERLNLNSIIKMLGVRDDIPALLKSSDLFVFPSECEGSPNAVVEACLAGIPIVACEVPGVRDVVQHGSSALLARPHNPHDLADCIEAALDDADGARRRADVARSWAESTYRAEDVLSQLYGMYDELLGVRTCNGRDESAPTLAGTVPKLQ
ncbi:MAG: glycosyltransferase [Pirellulales bacterium]|nr:glycosyltransferase [Pirellulales bacterium]